MIEIANVMSRHFINHQEALAKVDPNLTLAWLEEKMAPLEQVTLDDFNEGTMMGLTEEVLAGMERCHQIQKRLRYHIELALKDQNRIFRQFGFHTYREKQKAQEPFIRWMESFVETVEKYKAEILAVQTPEHLFPELKEAVEKLDKDNKKQEFAKDDRSGYTIERVTALNKVYDALRRIEDVAEFAFEEGTKERMFFTMPVMTRTSKGDGEDDTDGPDTSNDPPTDEAAE